MGLPPSDLGLVQLKSTYSTLPTLSRLGIPGGVAFAADTSTTQCVGQGIVPGAARRYAPADGSSTVAKIAADLRGPQSARLWWPACA